MERRIFLVGTLSTLAIASCKSGGTNYNSEAANIARDWNVKELNVVAASQLTVSLENSLTPKADIVWFENLPEDPLTQLETRRPEVRRILAQNVAVVTDQLVGPRDVRMDVVLEKFQGPSPLARGAAALGRGVTHVAYKITTYDFHTGETLAETNIVAETPVLGRRARDEQAARGLDTTARVGQSIQRATAAWLGLIPDIRV